MSTNKDTGLKAADAAACDQAAGGQGAGDRASGGPTSGAQSAATPHDTYFRYVFGQAEPARDLVLNVLRPEMGLELPAGDRVVAVQPQSLSFVDEQLAEHRSDLLVTLRTASGRELAVVNSLNQAALPESFREATVKYLVQGRGDNARNIVATLKEEGYTVMGETMISYAEELRRAGEATGIQKGKAEGIAEALVRLMERKFALSASEFHQIREARDLRKLQAALDEAIEPDATPESVLKRLV